jgi:hypothetical protein
MTLKKLYLVVVGLVMVLTGCPNPNDSDKNENESYPVIYVAGYESNGTNNVAKIWKSTDDGTTWTATAITDGTHRAGMTGLTADSSAFYVFGVEYDNSDNAIRKVWKSINGGANWTVTKCNYDRQWYGNLAFFTDGSALYVSGSFEDGTGALWKSVDDGANWTVIPFTSGGGDTGTADGSTIYVVGARERYNNGEVLKSTDGGVSWVSLTGNLADYTQSFPGGILVNGSRLLIAGSDYNNNVARIWKSTDGGITWTTTALTKGTTYSSARLAIIHGSTFYVSGSESDGTNTVYKVWKSTDEGITWTETSLSGFVLGFAVHGSTVYALGAELNGNNLEDTKLWKTTNNGTTWTEYAITDGTQNAVIRSIIIRE